MLKIRIATLIFISSLVLSCSDDDGSIPVIDNEILTINEIKSLLNSANDSNDLVIGTTIEIIDGIEYTVVNFESKDSIFFKSSLLSATFEEPKKWNLIFEFADNSFVDTGFIGDSLHIKSIQLNPHSTAPLSALISIEMPVKGKFEIEVIGKENGGITIGNRFEKFDEDHQLSVLGLYQNYENVVRINFLSNDNNVRLSKTCTIQTDELESQPIIEVIENNHDKDDDHIYFVSDLCLGFDQKGEVRWTFSGSSSFLYRKLTNGNLIISSGEDKISYHSKSFYEVTMLGEIVKEYAIPNYQHHEIRELPNGNFLVASNSQPIVLRDGNPEEDLVIEVDRVSGSIIKSWDLNEILDPTRTPIPGSRPDDWFHLNAVYYDQDDQSIVVSGRSQSCVAKIDYNTNEVKWILANHNLWSPAFANKLLTPVNDSGSEIDVSQMAFWTAGQHAPLKLPNGNVMIYDNGDYRGFYDNPDVTRNSYTRIVEYEIDEFNNKVKLVSEFSYKNINTPFTGDIDYIAETGGYLIGFMNATSNSELVSTPKILELSSTKEILFEVDIDPNAASYYRAERMHIYDGL